MNDLTLEQFRDVLPKQVRGAISDTLIDAVNDAIEALNTAIHLLG